MSAARMQPYSCTGAREHCSLFYADAVPASCWKCGAAWVCGAGFDGAEWQRKVAAQADGFARCGGF